MNSWTIADLFWILPTVMFLAVGLLGYVQIRAQYFRLLIRLGKVELRPLQSITLGHEQLAVNRKAIYIRGTDSGIVMYLTGDLPLILNLPKFGLNPTFTKGDLVFRSRVGGAPSTATLDAVAWVLAENRWVELPEFRRYLVGNSMPIQPSQ